MAVLTKPKKIISSPGVYIFKRNGTPLYIGKALNLKKRLVSYFRKDKGRRTKDERMLEEATRLETVETESEIEALIKEAELIKKYRPKYNILMRDDKSYFYVAITKEPFPRIFVTHQPRYETLNSKLLNARNKSQVQSPKRNSGFGLGLKPDGLAHLGTSGFRYIGPFTSGGELKIVLKLLRRVFPYCTCKRLHKRPCLNAEIGRCPGYCCSVNQKSKVKSQKIGTAYRRDIKNITAVLEGKKTRLIGRLKREMKEAVKRERYEEAARLRDSIFGLEDIFAHRQVLRAPEPQDAWPTTLSKLQALLKTNRTINRIEGYDISNISGTDATGSMVVFTNGRPDKSQYRKFRIKTVHPIREKTPKAYAVPPLAERASNGVKGISDVGMIKEVLQRRFNHPEWPHPDLVVIDGGKQQLNAALTALRKPETRNQKPEITIVTALAKREEILYAENGRVIPLKRQDPAILHLFQRIRDESHRFARAYHHKLREKLFATSINRKK